MVIVLFTVKSKKIILIITTIIIIIVIIIVILILRIIKIIIQDLIYPKPRSTPRHRGRDRAGVFRQVVESVHQPIATSALRFTTLNPKP